MSDFEQFCHGEYFQQLAAVMEKLRSPEGCPWDKEQTHESLKKYLLEETYEVLDALDSGDPSSFCDELGDLLFQVMFHAQLATEDRQFTIDDVVQGISAKMIRRHPHVFREKNVETSEEVLTMWEAIKAQEKKNSGQPKKRGLMDINNNMPSLLMTQKIQDKGARVGISFADPTEAEAALQTGLTSLTSAEEKTQKEAAVGDILFAAVRLANAYGVDAEMALRQKDKEMMERFCRVEDILTADNKQWGDVDTQKLLALWQSLE